MQIRLSPFMQFISPLFFPLVHDNILGVYITIQIILMFARYDLDICSRVVIPFISIII